MAKKVVASLQTGKVKNTVKCIKMVKSDSGSYSFDEQMVILENMQAFFAK
ncbi:MAG: DUF4295 domain-containing protein [Bacteroidales bacterium]|nr:DUF4295 domain-containing protein [Bacteroidales bacterium]MCF8392178.1 DUF4295 domain-containing protein [Bacteroidales bacterium]